MPKGSKESRAGSGSDEATDPLSNRRVRAIWLGAILLVAGVLRGVGLTFGFPLRVHPDEWAVVDNAVDLARRGSFDPTFFSRPDHFEIKLNFLVDSLYSWVRFQLPLAEAFAQHELSFVFIGRSLSALFGLGCVWVAYLIVRRFSIRGALIAAALVGLFPLLVLNSHYATPEMPQAFFMLLLIHATVRYLEQPGLLWLGLAGAWIGVGFTIKYPAIFLAVVVAAVVIVVAWRQRSWRLLLGHAAFSIATLVAAVFVVSPVLITDFGSVLEAMRQQGEPGHLGADGLNWYGNVVFYVSTFGLSAGPLLSGSVIVGAIWFLRKHPVASLPLWAGVVYGLLLSTVALHWTRWGVPMYITPLLFGGVGIDVVVSWLWRARFVSVKAIRVAVATLGVTLAALIGLNQLAAAAATTAGLAATDTRVVGLRLLKSLGAKKSTTIYEGYTPYLPGAPWAVFANFVVVDGHLELTAKAPKDARVLVIGDGMRARYMAEARYTEEAKFYAAVSNLPSLGVISPVQAPPSYWEWLNIWQQGKAVVSFATGGLSGPRLYLYDISSLPRAR